MKPMINPESHNPSFVRYENGHVWHRLDRRDDIAELYWTVCGNPVAFEEKFVSSKSKFYHPLLKSCEECDKEYEDLVTSLGFG